MFCGKCGSKLEDGMKFCPSCGTDVGKTENVKVLEAVKKKNVKSKKWGIIAVVIVLIAVLGCLVVWQMNEKREIEDSEVDSIQNDIIDTQELENTEDRFSDSKEEESVMKTRVAYRGTDLFYKQGYDEHGNEIYFEYIDGSQYITEYTYIDDRIESVITKTYNEDGVLEEELYTSCIYIEEGNELKQYLYDASGNLTGIQNYNEKGQLISRSDSEGKESKTWKYDTSGNLIESKMFNEQGKLEQEIFYNEYGDPISVYEYDTQGNFISRSEYEYEYDIYENETAKHVMVYDNELTYEGWTYYEYTYDEDGNMLEQYEYTEDGTLYYYVQYTYY